MLGTCFNIIIWCCCSWVLLNFVWGVLFGTLGCACASRCCLHLFLFFGNCTDLWIFFHWGWGIVLGCSLCQGQDILREVVFVFLRTWKLHVVLQRVHPSRKVVMEQDKDTVTVTRRSTNQIMVSLGETLGGNIMALKMSQTTPPIFQGLQLRVCRAMTLSHPSSTSSCSGNLGRVKKLILTTNCDDITPLFITQVMINPASMPAFFLFVSIGKKVFPSRKIPLSSPSVSI